MTWRYGQPGQARETGPAETGGTAAASRGSRLLAAARTAGSAGALRSPRVGAVATALSVLATVTVAAAGPSVMEPPLPGRPGQPPWSFGAHPSPYLVVALTGGALIAGTFGLVVTLRAVRHGWRPPPRLILAAGLAAAVILAFLPPFGSADHLSYAAYGRMFATGHSPYLHGPSYLAKMGDPVARAAEPPWQNARSVYGVLATAGEGLASLIGGTSVRLTVFVLSLLNLACFAGTGLLLHRLAAGDRARQLRAALLWTANPLLLQVLVAGEHMDSQGIVFEVAAVAALAAALRRAASPGRATRCLPAAIAAGALAGLGLAVKLTMGLVGAGLLVACLLARPAPDGGRDRGRTATLVAGLAAGFAVVAGAALAIGGLASVRPALSAGDYVAVATPWRWLRSLFQVATGEQIADTIVKIWAVAAIVAFAWLMLRRLPGPLRLGQRPALAQAGESAAADGGEAVALVARAALAFALAWLTAGPYVLPWYDALAWGLLPLLPVSAIDWFVLARTASLSVGYLPARTVVMPGGLRWLETVVRTGVTPALLLIVAAGLAVELRARPTVNPAVPAASAP